MSTQCITGCKHIGEDFSIWSGILDMKYSFYKHRELAKNCRVMELIPISGKIDGWMKNLFVSPFLY
jgi:hypothetical protein